MKKLMFAVSLGLISGSLYAACLGPFCYDDQGAYIGGTINDGNGVGVPSATAVVISSMTPRSKGQVIFCNNCTNANAGKGVLCVSTGTTQGAYVAVSSGTTVTNCL